MARILTFTVRVEEIETLGSSARPGAWPSERYPDAGIKLEYVLILESLLALQAAAPPVPYTPRGADYPSCFGAPESCPGALGGRAAAGGTIPPTRIFHCLYGSAGVQSGERKKRKIWPG